MAKPQKDGQKYALISVYDKTGIVNFANEISKLGYTIITTGGTAKALEEAKIPYIPIQEITGNPESFDGRMKTISFEIESGILFDRTNFSHKKQASDLKIKQIDIVVNNLYPFEQATSDSKVKMETAVENIDVGGPTMIRAAAKNFKSVLIVVDPKDYSNVLENLNNNSVTEKLRQELAAKAFAHLSFYDSQIAKYLNHEQFPDLVTIPGRRTVNLRYGENPHQKAAVYIEPNTNSPLSKLEKLTGRELSYVNFTDIFAGLESVRQFEEAAAVVIKHNSPSGIALGTDAAESLQRAVAADPVSAFGGVIVLNKPLDLKTAQTFAGFKESNGVLIDIVAAPSVTTDAQEFIKTVRKTTGIYTFGKIPSKRTNNLHARFFDGGFVLQDWDDNFDFSNWKVAGKFKPTEKQMNQAKIAWKFISRIRSNTVIVVDPTLPMTRGIGSGQTSRVKAVELALQLAGKHVKDAILASDSFFPFDDSVKLAAKAGVGVIVEQGGSIKDELSIAAADKASIPIIFTGERKFWH